MNLYRTRMSQALLGAIVLATAAPAMAACTIRGTVTHPVSGSGQIEQTGKIGTSLGSGSKIGDSTLVLSCEAAKDATFRSAYYDPSAAGWSKGNNYLQTNIPGIGVRIAYRTRGGDGSTSYSQYPYTVTIPMPGKAGQTVGVEDSGETLLDFFRTAASTNGGKVDSIEIGAQWTEGTPSAYRSVKIENVVFNLAACSIHTGDSDKVVELGDHKASDITRNGTTDWRTFTLRSTDCDVSQMSDARFTFSGTAASDPKLFAVSGGAQGIGIELWTDGDATNQQVIPGAPLVRQALIGGLYYGFKARYRLLAGQKASAGKADAVVNLNVSFH